MRKRYVYIVVMYGFSACIGWATPAEAIDPVIVTDTILNLEVNFDGDINPATGAGGALATINTANWGDVSMKWAGFVAGISFVLDVNARHSVAPHLTDLPFGDPLNWLVVAPAPLRMTDRNHDVGHNDHYTLDLFPNAGLLGVDRWTLTGVHQVPEPSTALLLALGGLVLARRRRRCSR